MGMNRGFPFRFSPVSIDILSCYAQHLLGKQPGASTMMNRRQFRYSYQRGASGPTLEGVCPDNRHDHRRWTRD